MHKPGTLLAALSVALVACGGGTQNTPPSTVGSAGATLKAGAATLTIPAGALSQDTPVVVREALPEHQGRVERIELEPSGLVLSQPARLSVKIDDRNVKVKMHGSDDALVPVEVEDHNHGEFKTTLNRLGPIEVEVEHGGACTPACASGHECDDGVCKADDDNANARTCTPICASGQECDDGACKPHGEVEGAGAASCDPACATGLECDDGVCKPHGGDDSGSGSGGGSGSSGGSGSGGNSATCNPACAPGLECDDGVCKQHHG